MLKQERAIGVEILKLELDEAPVQPLADKPTNLAIAEPAQPQLGETPFEKRDACLISDHALGLRDTTARRAGDTGGRERMSSCCAEGSS